MKIVTMAAFADELTKIADAEKDAGLADTVRFAAQSAKKALTTDIPGTPTWLLNKAPVKTMATGARNALRSAPVARSNVHDVSAYAKALGLN